MMDASSFSENRNPFSSIAQAMAPSPNGQDLAWPYLAALGWEAQSGDLHAAVNPTTILPPTREPPLSSRGELIVAFRLFGPGDLPLLSVDDLEVLSRGEERLWPVLRVLSLLGEKAEILESDEEGPALLSFLAQGGRKAEISVRDSTARVGTEPRSADVVRKWSEFSNAVEVYVSEPVMAESLGFQVEWRELTFEIVARAKEFPRWYVEKLKQRRLNWSNVYEIPPNLPEVLPPAEPRDWGLDFVEISLAGVYSSYDDLKEKETELQRPIQRIWARAAGGAFRLDLSEKGLVFGADRTSPGPGVNVDRVWWELASGADSITAGDAELGLGELVFPGASLTGLRWTHGRRAGSLGRIRPETSIEESAPLDSQVDLYVNDTYVTSTRVRDPLKNTPGFGYVRFDGVPLIPGRENTIRLVITEPSGYRREVLRTVWGSDKVLNRGETSVIAGLGTHREKDEWFNYGAFAGALLRYGVADALTAEVTGGYQNRFLPPELRDAGREDDFYSPYYSYEVPPAPEESYHVGAGLAWQPYSGGFAKADVARSVASEDKSGWAARLRGEFGIGSLSVRPDLFRYEPDFFDGQSSALQDREGLWVSTQYPVLSYLTLHGAGGLIRNDVKGDALRPWRETIGHLEARLLRLPLRTQFSLAGDYVRQHGEGEDSGYLYTAILGAWPTSRLELEGRVADGDSLDTWEHVDLVGPLRLRDLPFYVEPYNGGRMSWTVTPGFSVSASHWNYQTRKESFLGLSLVGQKSVKWDFQSELGRSWDEWTESLQEALIWRARLGYYLNRSGNRRFSLQTDYRDQQWSLYTLVNINEVIGFDGATPLWLTQAGASPAMGCVMGRVFLDLNGDGHRQPEEPGVKGVPVRMERFVEKSDEDGRVVFTQTPSAQDTRVSLELPELDALYTPTQGTQLLRVTGGTVGHVELGVAILGAVKGAVSQVQPDGSPRPVAGVLVGLYDREGRRVVASVTASDGSYYLGEIRPGIYWIKIDSSSLKKHKIEETVPKKVTVTSGTEEPLDQKVDLLVTPKDDLHDDQKVDKADSVEIAVKESMKLREAFR